MIPQMMCSVGWGTNYTVPCTWKRPFHSHRKVIDGEYVDSVSFVHLSCSSLSRREKTRIVPNDVGQVIVRIVVQ